MANLITKRLGDHVAQQLIESITEPANNVYYLVASKHTEYTNGDDTIPLPLDSIQDNSIRFYEEALFGKKIGTTDVIRMIPRYEWTSNTAYAKYDHTDGDLFNKQYYVVYNSGATYFVYKVIDNNGGERSTVAPTDTSENAETFTTSDGYKWLLMYKLESSAFEKFATSDFMPVVTSSNVSSLAVPGAIDHIEVSNNGSNYIATLTGQFSSDDLKDSIPTITGNNTTYRLSTAASSNSNFYTGSAIYISGGTGAGQIKKINSYDASNRVIVVDSLFNTPPGSGSEYVIAPWVEIVGDGSGAKAYAEIASNSSVSNYVSNINVINRGNNYTYASAVLIGNTGGVSNNAQLKVIVPPPGGHGSDAEAELGSSMLGVSVTFNTNESGFITTSNDYRTLSILKDPLFSSVTLSLTSSVGTFETGETVSQVNYKVLSGTITSNAACNIISGIGTDFTNSFTSGDKILILDTINSSQCIRTVTSVTNSTSLTVNSTPDFNAAFASHAFAAVTATGVKTGNNDPYVTLGNTEPKFVTGKRIIGNLSGAWANVSAIDVQEKSYNNWNTFDNRVRLGYSANTGAFANDALVYQVSSSVANGYFHSANSSYAFITSEKGSLSGDLSETLTDGSIEYTLTGAKYVQDIVKGSGDILYVENSSPITRSNSQSEVIRLILKF